MDPSSFHSRICSILEFVACIPEKKCVAKHSFVFSPRKDKKNGKTWIHMTYNSLSEKNTKTREFPLGPNALRLWDREKPPVDCCQEVTETIPPFGAVRSAAER